MNVGWPILDLVDPRENDNMEIRTPKTAHSIITKLVIQAMKSRIARIPYAWGRKIYNDYYFLFTWCLHFQAYVLDHIIN